MGPSQSNENFKLWQDLNLTEFWENFTFSDLCQIGAIEWFVNSSMVKQFDMFLFVTCFKPLEHTKYEPTCEFEFELIWNLNSKHMNAYDDMMQ